MERVPVHGLDLLHKITGDDKWENYSSVLSMVWDQIDELIGTYNFFVRGTWEFENRRIYEDISKMSAAS